jgi:hypothetical protein
MEDDVDEQVLQNLVPQKQNQVSQVNQVNQNKGIKGDENMVASSLIDSSMNSSMNTSFNIVKEDKSVVNNALETLKQKKRLVDPKKQHERHGYLYVKHGDFNSKTQEALASFRRKGSYGGNKSGSNSSNNSGSKSGKSKKDTPNTYHVKYPYTKPPAQGAWENTPATNYLTEDEWKPLLNTRKSMHFVDSKEEGFFRFLLPAIRFFEGAVLGRDAVTRVPLGAVLSPEGVITEENVEQFVFKVPQASVSCKWVNEVWEEENESTDTAAPPQAPTWTPTLRVAVVVVIDGNGTVEFGSFATRKPVTQSMKLLSKVVEYQAPHGDVANKKNDKKNRKRNKGNKDISKQEQVIEVMGEMRKAVNKIDNNKEEESPEQSNDKEESKEDQLTAEQRNKLKNDLEKQKRTQEKQQAEVEKKAENAFLKEKAKDFKEVYQQEERQKKAKQQQQQAHEKKLKAQNEAKQKEVNAKKAQQQEAQKKLDEELALKQNAALMESARNRAQQLFERTMHTEREYESYKSLLEILKNGVVGNMEK